MKSELDKFKLFYEAEPIFSVRQRLFAQVLYIKRQKAKKNTSKTSASNRNTR